jgi:hypothetical protein
LSQVQALPLVSEAVGAAFNLLIFRAREVVNFRNLQSG